jgi:glycine/D-amino acid oxidase-like deaminating enzyme
MRTAASRGETEQGDIACDKVVNCAGQWARQVGAMAGINVPLQPVKHQYIITEKIAGLATDAADDPRSRPAHLLQGGGRRTGHGRLRAEPASLDDEIRGVMPTIGSSGCSMTITTISSST